jgi:hypothetical protein
MGFQLIGITTIPQEMMAIKGDEFPPWFQASNRLWSWWNWPRMMKHWYYHQILYHQIGIYNDNDHQILDFIYPKWPLFFFGSLKNMISWDRSRNVSGLISNVRWSKICAEPSLRTPHW